MTPELKGQLEYLKTEGHKFMDKAVCLGENRTKLYQMLAKRLKRDRLHFSDTNDPALLIQMNLILGRIVDKREVKMREWEERIKEYKKIK